MHEELPSPSPGGAKAVPGRGQRKGAVSFSGARARWQWTDGFACSTSDPNDALRSSSMPFFFLQLRLMIVQPNTRA
jgi:hypothetical protein